MGDFSKAIKACDEYKFKITYGGGKEEIVTAANVEEARKIAASKARGWGYNVTKANDRSSLEDNDLKDVREAIGFLKNANSKLGMIDNRFVQTCKNKIADCIATLEKV